MLSLIRTARITGLLYLGLAITGVLGFLVVRPRLFDSSNPDATLANLLEHEGLARLGIALELGIVVTQALTAVWFYRLFRSVDTFAAGTLAAYDRVPADPWRQPTCVRRQRNRTRRVNRLRSSRWPGRGLRALGACRR